MSEAKTDPKEAKEARKRAGAYIRKLRVDCELSQRALAGLLGYANYTFISQIENGSVRLPPDMLEDCARALGVDTRSFAKTLLRHYEPQYYRAIFPDG